MDALIADPPKLRDLLILGEGVGGGVACGGGLGEFCELDVVQVVEEGRRRLARRAALAAASSSSSSNTTLTALSSGRAKEASPLRS